MERWSLDMVDYVLQILITFCSGLQTCVTAVKEFNKTQIYKNVVTMLKIADQVSCTQRLQGCKYLEGFKGELVWVRDERDEIEMGK